MPHFFRIFRPGQKHWLSTGRVRPMTFSIMALALGTALSGCSEDSSLTEPTETPATTEIEGFIVSPASLLLAVGATQDLSAAFLTAAGDTVPATEISWSSSDSDIARVNASGVVTAVGVGNAVVAVRSDTDTLEVPATIFEASEGDFVTFPTEEIGFILGPQLTSGSSLNPWPWFDENALAMGHQFGNAFGASPSHENYYDQARVQYTNYFRTGDVQFLDYGRKVADGWYEYVKPLGVQVAPRMAGISGLMLRAMDGRPEIWQWITEWTDHHMKIWLENHVSDPTLHYGLRDGGYALYYGALLAAAHPDPEVRAEYLGRILTVARDYYARLQYDNGGWYWSDSYAEVRIPKGDDEFYLHCQPFMVGLMLEGLIAVHRLVDDPVVADAIIGGTEWLYRYGYRPAEPSPIEGLNWRGAWYFVFEPGTPLPSASDYPDGAAPRYGSDGVTVVQGTTDLRDGWDPNSIRDVRQLNGTQIHAFGYAYKISGDPRFLTWGDDIFSASFGNGVGPGADASYLLADYIAKTYNQAYRTSGTYLARRLGQ